MLWATGAQKDPEVKGRWKPQREMDAILVSVGANDIAFADILLTCVLTEDCENRQLGLESGLRGRQLVGCLTRDTCDEEDLRRLLLAVIWDGDTDVTAGNPTLD